MTSSSTTARKPTTVASPSQACRKTSSSTFFKPRPRRLPPESRATGCAPAADVGSSQSALGKKSSRSAGQFFRNQIRISRERTMRKPFSDTSQPIISSVLDKHGAGSRGCWVRKGRIGAGHDHRGGAVSEQPGRNQVGHYTSSRCSVSEQSSDRSTSAAWSG